MDYTTQIKNLEIIAKQFISGDIEIKHAKINHPTEGLLEWFEYYNSAVGTASSPDFYDLQDDILAECAEAIRVARHY
jgi:hypothetical protein